MVNLVVTGASQRQSQRHHRQVYVVFVVFLTCNATVWQGSFTHPPVCNTVRTSCVQHTFQLSCVHRCVLPIGFPHAKTTQLGPGAPRVVVVVESTGEEHGLYGCDLAEGLEGMDALIRVHVRVCVFVCVCVCVCVRVFFWVQGSKCGTDVVAHMLTKHMEFCKGTK